MAGLALPALDAADLAGDGLGQLGDELDLARVLVGSAHLPAVVLTNAFTIWPRSGSGLLMKAASVTVTDQIR